MDQQPDNLVQLEKARGLFVTNRAEAVRIAEAVLAAARSVGDRSLEAQALNLLADAERRDGKTARAGELAEAALAAAEAAGDERATARSMNLLAALAWHQGEFDRAIELTGKVLKAREKLGDERGVAAECGNLAMLHTEKGDLARALEFQQRCLALREKLGDRAGAAQAWLNVGVTQMDLGDWDRALESYFRALGETERLGDNEHFALCCNNIGELYLYRGRLDRARFYLERARELAAERPDSWIHAEVLGTLGETAFAGGDLAEAEVLYERDRAICRQSNDREELAETTRRLAELALARGDAAAALNSADEALQLATEAGARREAGNARRVRAMALAAGGKRAAAREELDRACATLRSLGRNYELARCLLDSGRLAIDSGTDAGPALAEARSIFTTIGAAARAIDVERLAEQQQRPKGRPAESLAGSAERGATTGIVGAETTLRRVLATVEQAAPTRANVLILGESGTGKEVLARALHRLSDRAAGPFVAVNCAAIPEALLEAELFGIEKGTATGVAGRAGRFETAAGGTLFLDEIGDMSPAIQAKLLRILQDRTFERVGGREPLQADVRVVAATHRDLAAAIEAGEFRRDLYYRLNVITVHLPPLRERRTDIPEFVRRFTERAAREYSRPVAGVSDDCLQALVAYDWPGNIRELENALERAVILARGDRVEVADLPQAITAPAAAATSWAEARRAAQCAGAGPIERQTVLAALEASGWVVKHAAEKLGISRRQLYRIIEKHGLSRPGSQSQN
jgi:DNA-binding NtrC family response regulator